MSSLTVEEDQKWLPTHAQVTVLRGRGLRGKGKHGTSDVYTIIQLGKEKYSTGVAEKTTEPEWREECSFELQPGVLESGSPAGSNELVLTVMHRALIGMDVFLGQAVVLLDKVFHETRSLKNQWYRLNSKTGKKEKERGDIQLCVQFTRNNLTASMYDLVMKDKSASTFSKLKDHITGKRRSSDKDSSSAVLPSGYGSLYRMRQRLPSDGGGEEDYEDDEGGEARRSKMRTFFLRGKLRKSSDTRSSASLGSESSESSSRGGSLSPTAGISVVVSDLSNSPSNSSNLTADNSPEHTANTSPKSSSLKCEFGDEEAGEITIAVPQPTVCVNGSHAYNVQPLDSGSGNPAGSLGLGLLHKSLPLSTSLQNLGPRASADVPGGPAGDGRRWSFDKPGEEEKAAIAAALEKSGPMVSEEEQEQEERLGRDALSKAASTESEVQGRKQRRNLFSLGRSESAGKSPSQAEQAAEEKHKGWFGSKDAHSKPSTDPHPPPHPPNRPLSVDPAPVVSSLHHTNPFCHSQSCPPPISRCNPFFTLLQQNSSYDGGVQTAEPPRPSPPPLPYLSIARPPIARLFPQTSDQTHQKRHVAEVCRDGMEIVRRRPLPPVPTEKQPLLRRSSNPFTSVEEREVDPDWDESFQAFAACRLQPPDEHAAESRTQQNASSDRPLERCSHQGALLPRMEAEENTNVNNALRHQTLSFDKVAEQATTFPSHHPDASPHVLEMIPEHRSFESDDTNFPNADFIEIKQQSSTTHDETETDVHGAPRRTSSVHRSSSSPEVTSSGIGSSADKDFLSCFSSQSDKLSALSAEETESNILSSGKPTVVKNRSESEDEITERSTDLSLDDAAHQTVIQHWNGDTEKVDQSGSDGSFSLCSLLHSHPEPGFTTEAGSGGVDTQTTQIPKSIDSLKSEESELDVSNISCGDLLEDWSTLSFHVATSSPVQQRLLDPSCGSVGGPNQNAANLKDSDVSNLSSSSFLLKLNVSCDSSDYQTCESWPSSECSDVSTLCGNAATNAATAASFSGLEDPEKPFDGGKVQSNGLEGPLSEPQTLEAPPAGLTDSYKSCSEGGVEDQHDVFTKLNHLQIATLHRSQSEGTLAPIFAHLQPSFGSDPGAMQLSSLAPPPPGLPSLTSFAPPLTSESCTSPVALRSFPPPLLANALPKSPPGVARVSTPTSPETAPQPQHQQGVEPQTSPHPVRPLSTAMQTEEKRSVLATGLEKLKSTIHPGRSSSSSGQPPEAEADRKKPLTEGAGSYYHLTHSELVALLVQREAELCRQRADFQRQKLLLAKREVELRRLKPQVRDLEDYIDTLLVRIMEQKPTLLQVRSKLK